MPTNSSLDLQRFYPDELEIVSIEEDSDEIRLHMLSRSKSFCCPKCGEELCKLHATHHRTVQDLPILGKRVFLDIRVHDFQCQNTSCEIGVFSETFHSFEYYRAGVPLFRRNGNRQSGGRKPLFRNRDTSLN